MNTIRPAINLENVSIDTRLDSLENVLNTINCSEIIVNKWRDILKLYIKYSKNKVIAQSDRQAIINFSMECSDTYGDVIHLARAMAHTFDNTYFDNYDDCIVYSEPRLHQKISKSNIEVYPNPTSGIVSLRLDEKYNGDLDITSIDGRKISTTNIKEGKLKEIYISPESGLYILKFTSDIGVVEIHKVIVIK